MKLRISKSVDALLVLHKPTLVARGIQVFRRDRGTLELKCYTGEIRQAIAHILNNALDALPSSGKLSISVRDSTSWTDPTRKAIRITLADSGCGIAKQDMPFIFDAFFTTKGINGTGLGLWISKEIIERHEGSIGVKRLTRAGTSGTAVNIFLPCR